jgi:CheY-like chemotaxis protein
MRKRVLVVDDDKYLVEAICEVLQDTGVQLLKAYSGFQGVQLATREAPDLIITDFEMPNGSAEYLLSILRQSEATRPIKVIVMTGHEVLERYRLSQNPASFLKVVSFQPKPLDLEGLCVEVRRQLAVA